MILCLLSLAHSYMFSSLLHVYVW